MEQQEREDSVQLQPLHVSSGAKSSTESSMPILDNAAALGEKPTPILRGNGRLSDHLPIMQSADHPNSHEIAFTFRIVVVLATSMFLMLGMVKIFSTSKQSRNRRRKKQSLDDTNITSNETTKDLEANKEDFEKETLLKTIKDNRGSRMRIRTNSTRKSPTAWLTQVGKDWMSRIDNDMSLASISMPGSHDSGSRYGGMYVTTQSWSIEDQLKSGIRFLDIRCRREGKVFTIHHGPFYQHLWFDQVLETIRSFLEEHPSETILIRVKEEYDPKEGSQSFVAIWDRYMNELGYGDLLAEYPWDGKSIPTLGQVRGKVVLLRNFDWNGPEIGLHYNRFGNAVMEVQDDYSIPVVNGIAKKKKEVRSFLEKAQQQCCQNRDETAKLIINHCSGTKPPVYTPSFVAKRTNRAAYDEIVSYPTKSYTGIIVMDFPGESLIHSIIQSNVTITSSPTSTSAR